MLLSLFWVSASAAAAAAAVVAAAAAKLLLQVCVVWEKKATAFGHSEFQCNTAAPPVTRPRYKGDFASPLPPKTFEEFTNQGVLMTMMIMMMMMMVMMMMMILFVSPRPLLYFNLANVLHPSIPSHQATSERTPAPTSCARCRSCR